MVYFKRLITSWSVSLAWRLLKCITCAGVRAIPTLESRYIVGVFDFMKSLTYYIVI